MCTTDFLKFSVATENPLPRQGLRRVGQGLRGGGGGGGGGARRTSVECLGQAPECATARDSAHSLCAAMRTTNSTQCTVLYTVELLFTNTVPKKKK